MPGKQRRRNINRIKDTNFDSKQNKNKSSGRKGGKSAKQAKETIPQIGSIEDEKEIEEDVSNDPFGE